MFRVKSRIGDTRKGVGNRSISQDQSRVKKYKKARYAIGNVSMKELYNKIKDFEKIVKVTYVKSIPKHEPSPSYFYLVLCIAECMMRCGEDYRNVHNVHDGYEEEMAPSSNVNDTDGDESEKIHCAKTF